MTSIVVNEMTSTFSNFNSVTIEIWEWISDLIPHYDKYDYWFRSTLANHILFHLVCIYCQVNNWVFIFCIVIHWACNTFPNQIWHVLFDIFLLCLHLSTICCLSSWTCIQLIDVPSIEAAISYVFSKLLPFLPFVFTRGKLVKNDNLSDLLSYVPQHTRLQSNYKTFILALGLIACR